jgi:hypothetical protein
MLGKAPPCAGEWASAADLAGRTCASTSPSKLGPNCAHDFAREGMYLTQNHPTPANQIKNPPVKPLLTDGFPCGVRLVRPALSHLTYPSRMSPGWSRRIP